MQAFSDENITQGLGIAATVIINAALFQQKLASQFDEISSLAQMSGQGRLHQAGLIEEWQKILEINYYPIYSVATSVLSSLSDPYIAYEFVKKLFGIIQSLVDLGVVETHDLCGVVFQRYITERKFLASYYTKSESATLLAHLAVPDVDWSNDEVYRDFRFADFACGTGSLVYSVYKRIAQLHEFQGGDPQSHHAHMMAENVTAADIVPSAAHLTATLLTSIFPSQIYYGSRVFVP